MIIFKRLNATALSMQAPIFLKDTSENKTELNNLSQLLSININLIHSLIEKREIDDEEIPEVIKNIFRVHIEFETFIFTEFVEKVNETDDFEEIDNFLKKRYLEIYEDLQFEGVITSFSKGKSHFAIETPQKFKSKSSNNWSNRGSKSNNDSHQNFFTNNERTSDTPGFGVRSGLKSPIGTSSERNPLTFKKKNKPEQNSFSKGNVEEIGEDEFPDFDENAASGIKEISIKTDSELEELQKNKQEFRAMENRTELEKKFADVLGFDENDQSNIASR